jgi:hypothetical protein
MRQRRSKHILRGVRGEGAAAARRGPDDVGVALGAHVPRRPEKKVQLLESKNEEGCRSTKGKI